ncbi:DUF975 family protein [Treponema berlinense]|uniref:DUF975 family protein n=1 Tax=Treponema berlinense TaxID=225004 RepID=UPI0026F15937|nr:DUF975 family protein [Treponema berlinense]
MFNRQLYKQTAKKQLASRKTVPVLATLITMAFLVILGSGSEIQSTAVSNAPYENGTVWDMQTVMFCFSSTATELLFSFLTVVITGILTLAECSLYDRYFNTLEKISFSEYLQGFSRWLTGALAALWFSLWVFLWSLLFFIPGIVKAFSYSQMFFILAENPKIGVAKAMRISKVLTKGYKADLFVMGLSFFGWNLLSIFTLGILQLWIQPYEYMSFTNAYKSLKMHALRSETLSESDFQA